MAQIIKAYPQDVPAFRFIGRKYTNKDRVNGTYGAKWSEWFQNGWFDKVEKMTDKKRDYEDSDSYIGLMRFKENEEFEYWIGIFMPEGTKVSEGFSYINFPKSRLGVCWVYGQERDLYGHEAECSKELMNNGFKIIPDEKGAYWFFERYGCPRFTTPDDKGNVILDICHYIK
jgi:predicted transcriptional regulator YdeE